MINFNIGDICEIDNPLQKRHGRSFEIIGFVYDKSCDIPHAPSKLKIKYLDTNRKGTYTNAFESLKVIGESENPNTENTIEIIHS
jgi:hypothetical protein|tara:strand:- start:85 stop:339 length:255 start_codon:yes stop_codon:yes gene_type:complete